MSSGIPNMRAPSAPPAPAVAPEASASKPFVADASFNDAVSAAVAAQMAAMEDRIAERLKTAAPGGGLDAAMDRLAMRIAELNDANAPSHAPVRISPEIVERRKKALDQMVDILMSYQPGGPRHSEEKPIYRAISTLYLNDTLVAPFRQDAENNSKKFVPVEFYWLGEPNDAMRPLNQIANTIYCLFQDSRSGVVRTDPGVVQKRFWATEKGMVIPGVGPKRRELGTEESTAPQISGIYDPNAEAIQILGTIHEPARQNAPLFMGQAPGGFSN